MCGSFYIGAGDGDDAGGIGDIRGRGRWGVGRCDGVEGIV